jgi:hypothetical protein
VHSTTSTRGTYRGTKYNEEEDGLTEYVFSTKLEQSVSVSQSGGNAVWNAIRVRVLHG